MNRNVESHFAHVPSINIGRSIFDRSSGHMTSFNAGDLIPIYIDEILPGDSVRMTTSKVIRAQTMLTPTFGNMYLDTYWWFIPMRLTWEHSENFFGQNDSSPWIPQVQYQIPSISAPSGGFATGTIADYMGLPVGVNWSNSASRRPSALPFRAYALVCDQWFRSTPLTDPLNIPLGDSNQTGTNGSNYINDVANGGMPFKVAKYHDYFTSALPTAQRGTPVSFNLLNNNKAPVVPGTDHLTGFSTPVKLVGTNGSVLGSTRPLGVSGSGAFASFDANSAIQGTAVPQAPANLWADLSTSLGAITVNELRLAFQLQKFYEQLARGGDRYCEIIRSFYNIVSPDSRLQRTEYLGGNRVPIVVHEVTNSAQSQQDFLGDLGAKSVTSDIHADFERSFTEHGYLLCTVCVRYDHTYTQGMERFWSRRKFSDFYWPTFANLGEMPVYDSEIFADATTMANDTVFGFQEAWADYRFKPDRASSLLRPGVQNTLSSWNFADYYTQKPTLSDGWIREDKTNIDRTLAVTSQLSDQFFGDFWFDSVWTRAMPVYSVPGLIDHH